MHILWSAVLWVLAGFYAWVAFLAVSPTVSDDYRRYYITRETGELHPRHYPAVLEDGMEFSKPGLPAFVGYTSGISHAEDWGRWTDANLLPQASIGLTTALEGNICIVLQCKVANKQIGKPVYVRVGDVVQEWLAPDGDVHEYRLAFALTSPADRIEIEPTSPARPREWDAGNGDGRKLGVGLQKLKILLGACPQEEVFHDK